MPTANQIAVARFWRIIFGTEKDFSVRDACETRTRIYDSIQSLTPEERMIIMMRFGFEKGFVSTREEVACALNRPIGTVRQVEENAISKLRHMMRTPRFVIATAAC